MPVTLQVLYPVGDGTRFDHDYYHASHLPMVRRYFGSNLERTLVTRISATAGGGEPAHHLIATLVFPDQAAFDAAMAVAGPVVADIATFTDTTPVMQVGEIVG